MKLSPSSKSVLHISMPITPDDNSAIFPKAFLSFLWVVCTHD